MNNLQDTPIVIAYEIGDCNSLEGLIEDIGNTVKEKLTNEVKHKPLKCNVTIVYSSIFEEQPYDKGECGNLQ